MTYFIPDTNHYLKILSDKDALKKEFTVMSHICKETTHVPFYHHFYESKTSLLEKLPHLTNLPEDCCAIEMDYIPVPAWSNPIKDCNQLIHLMQQLMDILELLYHEGCIYTDFNLSNFLITNPSNYKELPTLYLIDFTHMIHFYEENFSAPSMDTCSRQLLTHNFNPDSYRDRILFLHRMVSVTTLHFAGLMDIPLNYEHPELTLSPNDNFYQKAKRVLTEPLLNKINFGFYFNGQITEDNIFLKWRQRLH